MYFLTNIGKNKEIKDKRRQLQEKSYTNVLGFILGRTLYRNLCLGVIASCLGFRSSLLGLRDNVPYSEGVLRQLVLRKLLHLLSFRYKGIQSSDPSREGLLRRNQTRNLANIFFLRSESAGTAARSKATPQDMVM